MSSPQQSDDIQPPPLCKVLHFKVPSLENMLHESEDLTQYYADLEDTNHALKQIQTSSNDYKKLQGYLAASLARQIKSQSRLLTATASSLRESESSRSLLEKQETTQALTGDIYGSTEYGTLVKEKITLKGENTALKELVTELQVGHLRLKTRYAEEKYTDKERIRLLWQDIEARDQRVRDIGE
ncbi:MAG: hypothetical protein Q9213_007517 [Squamulea squamosa]